MPAPEGFIIPKVGENTPSLGVLKAVTGAIGPQAARFYIHKIYDHKVTQETKKETLRPMEMVGFRNDKFTEYACRVEDQTPQQKYLTQALYERFRSQKESDDTPLELWEDAISEWEKAQLINSGILTVEQIAAYQDHELFKLGPGGKHLREKARWHVNAKNPSKADEQNAEMLAVLEAQREERERERSEWEARFAAMQAEMEALKGGETKKVSKRVRHKVEVQQEAA